MALQAEVARDIAKAEDLICQELHGPALVKVFTPPKKAGSHIIIPELYFLAAGELLCLMIAVSWVITLIAQPASPVDPTVGLLKDNALKRRLGYNNLCVGFDTAPATYVASVMWVFVSFLAIKFAWLDLQRTSIMRKEVSAFTFCFSAFTDVLYMVAFATFSLVFIVKPWTSVWGHSGAFILLMVAQYLVVVANILEGKKHMLSSIFCVFYGLVTAMNIFMIGSNYIYYSRNGHGPWGPWWLGAAFDYGWFGCLPLTTIFLPKGEGLKTTIEIVDPEEIGAVQAQYQDEIDEDENEALGLCGGGCARDDDDEIDA